MTIKACLLNLIFQSSFQIFPCNFFFLFFISIYKQDNSNIVLIQFNIMFYLVVDATNRVLNRVCGLHLLILTSHNLIS